MIRIFKLGIICVACLMFSAVPAAPLDALEQCIARVTPKEEGLVALQAVCPDLEAALKTLGYSELLCNGCKEHIDVQGLEDLRMLAARYQQAPNTRRPEIAVLQPILDELARERVQQPRSWWDIIREWILKHLQSREPQSFGWLKRLLAGSAGFFRISFYVLMVAVLIAAAYIVVRSLRAVRPFSRRRASESAGSLYMSRAAVQELSMRDLDEAAPLEKPAILLRLLVAKLLRSGRLARERDLTHRELTLQAVFDTQAQREQFSRVAQSAEAVLYGVRSAPTDVESVVAEGRALFEGIVPRGSRQ